MAADLILRNWHSLPQVNCNPFRILDFRVLGFRVLGFRVLGF